MGCVVSVEWICVGKELWLTHFAGLGAITLIGSVNLVLEISRSDADGNVGSGAEPHIWSRKAM